MNIKSFAVAALVLTGALGAGVAQARSDVQWSVSIGLPLPPLPPLPVVIVRPPPVYAPAPVYVSPEPVHYQPAPGYYQPAPVYYQPAPVYYERPAYGRVVYGRPQPTRWDVDGDGIPNRHDRYDNRYEPRGHFRDRHDHHRDHGRDDGRDGYRDRDAPRGR